MKIPAPLHRWSLKPKTAIRLQRRLAALVRVERLRRPVRWIAGVDVAFSSDGTRCVAGVVVYEPTTGQTIETRSAVRPVRFPYIPGLLSFREAPATLAVLRKLDCEPDLLMFDAQGIAHPRRLGLASHIGILVGRPSIGCAKSRLCGSHEPPPAHRGRFVTLYDDTEIIGAVLRTRTGVKPLFVSIGHRVTLDDAVKWVMACVDRYRLPEPTRLAHLLVTRQRKAL